MRIATVREVTVRHTDMGDFIICPIQCYSNGTDKNIKILTFKTVYYKYIQNICILQCSAAVDWATGKASGQ